MEIVWTIDGKTAIKVSSIKKYHIVNRSRKCFEVWASTNEKVGDDKLIARKDTMVAAQFFVQDLEK